MSGAFFTHWSVDVLNTPCNVFYYGSGVTSKLTFDISGHGLVADTLLLTDVSSELVATSLFNTREGTSFGSETATFFFSMSASGTAYFKCILSKSSNSISITKYTDDDFETQDGTTDTKTYVSSSTQPTIFETWSFTLNIGAVNNALTTKWFPDMSSSSLFRICLIPNNSNFSVDSPSSEYTAITSSANFIFPGFNRTGIPEWVNEAFDRYRVLICCFQINNVYFLVWIRYYTDTNAPEFILLIPVSSDYTSQNSDNSTNPIPTDISELGFNSFANPIYLNSSGYMVSGVETPIVRYASVIGLDIAPITLNTLDSNETSNIIVFYSPSFGIEETDKQVIWEGNGASISYDNSNNVTTYSEISNTPYEDSTNFLVAKWYKDTNIKSINIPITVDLPLTSMTFNWIPGTSDSGYTFQSTLSSDSKSILITLNDTDEIPLSLFTNEISFNPPGTLDYKKAGTWTNIPLSLGNRNNYIKAVRNGTRTIRYTNTFDPSIFVSVIITVNFINPSSNICFLAGSKVYTDQGLISIEELNTAIHTINKQTIVAITQTTTKDKNLVHIPKDILGPNQPSQKTVCSRVHNILYNGIMTPAYEIPGIEFIPYNDEILYNILLKTYSIISVNNIIVETLHPNNPIAILYRHILDNKISGLQLNKLISDFNTNKLNIKFDFCRNLKTSPHLKK